MKTYSAKPGDIKRNWYVVDATDVVLGRLAAVVANRLRGKHKPIYTPHMDTGDNIIVINAGKVKLTGNKRVNKKFYWHTGHPGGIKERSMAQILDGAHPERAITRAVERMISKGPLRAAVMKKLHVYAGDTHPHDAQQPKALDLQTLNAKNKRGIK